MMYRNLLLLVLCFAAPAEAGLFSDDDARKQIQQLEVRIQQLDLRVQQHDMRVQQLESRIQQLDLHVQQLDQRVQQLDQRVQQLDELRIKQEDSIKQQTKSMLDLLGQIEALNVEIRKLRGQNEEIAHGLLNAEKREKDFYVDLDTRLRRFEPMENATQTDSPTTLKLDDPIVENRAFEAAYGLFKGGSFENAAHAFQEFIKKYPLSVHVPNAYYWLGNAQFTLKDYKNALATYQELLKDFPATPRAADVLFNIAGCQQELKQGAAAQKTLKQLVAKYPGSEAADKASKLIAAGK